MWKNWRKFIVHFSCLHMFRTCTIFHSVFFYFSWIIIYLCGVCLLHENHTSFSLQTPQKKKKHTANISVLQYIGIISGIVFIINKYSSYTISHYICVCFLFVFVVVVAFFFVYFDDSVKRLYVNTIHKNIYLEATVTRNPFTYLYVFCMYDLAFASPCSKQFT